MGTRVQLSRNPKPSKKALLVMPEWMIGISRVPSGAFSAIIGRPSLFLGLLRVESSELQERLRFRV